MKIALFFGTFNPIHIGHLIIGSNIADLTEVEQVWFVVSPQSPLKQKESLLNEYDRLHLVRLAISDDDRFRVSNVEFNLPRPSYTIDTLTYLREQNPEHIFSIVTGSDNLVSLPKWKNYEILVRDYDIYAYPRSPLSNPFEKNPRIKVLQFPFLDISSTHIREIIKAGDSPRYYLSDAVYRYVDEMNLYK